MGTCEGAEVIDIPDQAGAPPTRERRSVATKRKIVEETLAPGASVARVARANGVNANQVFSWRRLYLAGRLGDRPRSTKLLPVTLPADAPESVEPGAIHIKLAHAQIRIEGSADVRLLRTVLKLLRA
jgi:transposase